MLLASTVTLSLAVVGADGIPLSDGALSIPCPTASEQAYSSKSVLAGTPTYVKDYEASVTVTSVQIGRAPILDSRGAGTTDGDFLLIAFRVENRSKAKKLQYTRPNRFLASHNTAVTDEHGNGYKWIELGMATKLLGRIETDNESIYPGTSLEDRVLFERPVGAASELKFRFPLAVFAEKDKRELGIRVPIRDWEENLNKMRAEYEAHQETGFRGLSWRAGVAELTKFWPFLKPNTPADRIGFHAKVYEYYALSATLDESLPKADVSAYLYNDKLYKIEIKFSNPISYEQLTKLVDPELGKPSEERGVLTWAHANTSVVGTPFGVKAYFWPIKMLETK